MAITPAHLAVEHLDLPLLRDLLDAGQDVEDDNGDGWTLLRHAIDVEIDGFHQGGGPLQVDATALLLARGADPLRIGERNSTPVWEAESRGHWLAAELLRAWVLSGWIGRRIEAVTEARHWFEGRRDGDAESLLHFWLTFEGGVTVQVHGMGDHLLLSPLSPYPSYAMDEHGETRVEPAHKPDRLASLTGRRLLGGSLNSSTLRLESEDGELTIRVEADEWVFGP
ncbi:hypothetical protein [Paractinoplanes lichenicola]|uniref:Ankyrin repeat domain-containing protein n=1 Tax=Paractinoplanes lichenicola TaxID=2802976 RepID=A0ABS1W2Z1_9ACTN|nr:hypothetical protein [Actinoplanes lichenicola]MBL7261082.1 hypothetical protein [Actinoplanes lichenicola]